ncbi:MAG TPA: M48 family metalloprotease [Thermoplasmata archaeon]|nr:M48 family metalloprotease [Thermoplasmata archaeon]
MTAPVVGLLYIPVLAWVAVGVGLLLAYRQSTSTVVFRLAVAFLACWAVFATTGLVWVLSAGGWSAVVRLATDPTLLVQPRFALVWAFGAVGAFAIFLTAFLLSQAVGRGFLAILKPRELTWPESVPRPDSPTQLLAFPADRVEAFTFTLLQVGPGGRPRRRDVILLSDGLMRVLSDEERAAVVAHELGHIRELDGRYLTFVRTLARMMRWDPILAYFASRLTEREEYRADLDAVELTRRPRALARALFKASRPEMGRVAPGLLGPGGRRGRRQAVERIRRLVALAESGRFPEEPGA